MKWGSVYYVKFCRDGLRCLPSLPTGTLAIPYRVMASVKSLYYTAKISLWGTTRWTHFLRCTSSNAKRPSPAYSRAQSRQQAILRPSPARSRLLLLSPVFSRQFSQAGAFVMHVSRNVHALNGPQLIIIILTMYVMLSLGYSGFQLLPPLQWKWYIVNSCLLAVFLSA